MSFIGMAQQTEHDNKLREDGAREAELIRRDEHDAIKEEANEYRKKNNSSTDNDVAKRL